MRLVVDDPRVLRAAADDLTALLDAVDRAASRFRSDSALSLANAVAGIPTPVPHLLVELVQAAIDGARDSDGLVDPTVGGALVANGYDVDIAEVTPDGSLAPVAAAGAWPGSGSMPRWACSRCPAAISSTSVRRPRPGPPTARPGR